MKWLLPAALTIALAVWLARRDVGALQSDAPDGYDPSQDDAQDAFDQTPTILEDLAVTLNPMTYIPADVPEDVAQRNERAFLDMIAFSEGTDRGNGYATAFGGGRIESLADHPRVYYPFTNGRGDRLKTSAAGRYQFLARTWDELAAKLNLPDFGPASQDAAALELIRQRGALADVRAGRTEAAIKKCASTWASLPGGGYAQPERKLSTLIAQYRAAGGNLEA